MNSAQRRKLRRKFPVGSKVRAAYKPWLGECTVKHHYIFDALVVSNKTNKSYIVGYQTLYRV